LDAICFFQLHLSHFEKKKNKKQEQIQKKQNTPIKNVLLDGTYYTWVKYYDFLVSETLV